MGILECVARDLAELRADLQLLSNDLKEQSPVQYAVDFCEIYAYIQPLVTFGEFRVFSDDSSREMEIAQRRALNRLFFGKERPILLPPYKVELERWFLEHSGTIKYQHALRYRTLTNEIIAAAKSPEFQHIEHVLNTLNDGCSSQDSRIQELLDFIESKSNWAIQLFDVASYAPTTRLKEVRKRTCSLAAPKLDCGLKNETRERWLELLNNARPEKGIDNFHDAEAIAIIASYNYQNGARPIRLVSRSQLMIDTAKRDSESGRWDHLGGQPVRHPRVFSFLYGLSDVRNDWERETRNAMSSIDVFLSMLEKEGTESVASRMKLATHLSRVKEKWHSGSALAGPLIGDNTNKTKTRESIRPIKKFMQHLRSTASLQKAIVDRIGEILIELEDEYQVLAFEILSDRSDAAKLNTEIRLRYDSTGITVGSTAYGMAHSVLLSDSNLPDRFDSDSNLQGHLSEIIQRIRDCRSFTRLMLISFVLSLRRWWDLSRDFVELAKNFATTPSEKYEAELLDAVVESHMGQSAEERTEHLQKAKATLEAMEGSGNWRVSRELSSVLFKLAETPYQTKEDKVIMEAKGESLAKFLLNEPSLDLLSRLRVLNNLSYLYVRRHDSSSLSRIQSEFDLAISRCKSTLGGIWPQVRHTRILVAWELQILQMRSGPNALRTLKRCAQELETLLQDPLLKEAQAVIHDDLGHMREILDSRAR